MSKILISNMVITLILVVALVTGVMQFQGALFTNYNVTLDQKTVDSLDNISTGSESMVETSRSIYETTTEARTDDVGILAGANLWVGASFTALKTALMGVDQVANIGGSLGNNLGLDSDVMKIIIGAIVTTVIFGFIATTFGRDEV